MGAFEIILLSGFAFCTSALTAVIGAGGGTALLALMLQFLAPASALPVHGAVQLASNTARIWLFRKHMAWPIIVRFSALMPLGVVLGLVAFQGLPTNTIQILIGVFVLTSVVSDRLKSWNLGNMPLWVFVPLGCFTGLLNMLVGTIAPFLATFILGRDLEKETMVGTLGFFGFFGNVLKIAGFTVLGFSFVEFGPLLLCMIPAAILGTRVGKLVLAGLDQKRFLRAFQIMLMLLALKLIVVDGLGITVLGL